MWGRGFSADNLLGQDFLEIKGGPYRDDTPKNLSNRSLELIKKKTYTNSLTVSAQLLQLKKNIISSTTYTPIAT